MATLPFPQPGSPQQQRYTTLASSASARNLVPQLPPEKFEQEIVQWVDRALRQAEEEAAQSLSTKLIPRVIQYLSGNQWPNRPTAYGSSRPVTNRMFRQYWELVSLLTDGNPEPDIKIYDTQDEYSETQSFLGTALEIWGNKPNYRDSLQDIIGFGLLARGIGKVQWNPHSLSGMGDVELLSINPLMFHTLGGDGSIASAECVIESRMVTIASLRRRYGRLADNIEPEPSSNLPNSQVMKPGALSSAEWGKLSPQIQRVIGKNAGTTGGSMEQLYPMTKLNLLWMLDPALNETGRTVLIGPEHANWSYLVEPGQALYPRGRLLSVAGTGLRARVMNDSCNPYFHASHPYVDMVPLRAPWSPEGMSLTGNLIGPQDILNRIMAGMLETIKAGLIPTIITPRNSVSRSDLDNMSTTISGGKLEYNPVSPAAPRFREQPQIPQLAMPFAQMIMQEMDQTTGSAAIDNAAQKEQVPSHDTMEMIQNSRSAMVRLMGRQLEGFMNRAGQMVVSNMLQFYSLGHRVALTGTKGILSSDFNPMYGSMMPTGMMPEEFVRKFQFSVKPGSSLSFGKEQRAQMAIVLRRQGDLSMINLFKALDANIDVQENMDQLAQEALKKLAVAALAGQATGAGQKK